MFIFNRLATYTEFVPYALRAFEAANKPIDTLAYTITGFHMRTNILHAE